ncbi:hypothetical protein GUITHDRAFT_154797 [Guillardia theta CCMP2712]|uniref:RWP-RK domain-containing protein n=1 Tax=Guillardia theta (strain CCMP2712) TaxID=905079 RepID=L1IP17_GUITC|nr:hypothetical protein GUITHDRAFT_154797 [Guillardia theta CCMP2712]EKX38036.1 hypothetical protein GUITHDRAFT_154797 [Guillardia theta CCMP2712]|eukprot:XP_005825016.1 hypothetical protein GUITHDRAFT_154797 [Guillardia theta CCMP2712]
MSVVYPRQKKEKDSYYVTPGPLFLDQELIEKYYHIPQCEAARQIGISLTCLKSACRKLGLRRWPYTRKYFRKHEGEAASQEDSQTSETPSNNPDESPEEHDEDIYLSFSDIIYTEVIDHMMGKFDSNETVPSASVKDNATRTESEDRSLFPELKDIE